MMKLLGSEAPLYVVSGVWMVVLLVVCHRMKQFRCPRCGKPFFQARWYHNDVARRCVHCGLKKWSDVGGVEGADC